MLELTPAEITDLRATIKLHTIAARASGKAVVNLIIMDGPLDGLALTMLDDPANEGLIGWSIARGTGPVTMMHKRVGHTLQFTGIEPATPQQD